MALGASDAVDNPTWPWPGLQSGQAANDAARLEPVESTLTLEYGKLLGGIREAGRGQARNGAR
jgi:hypothetical protein